MYHSPMVPRIASQTTRTALVLLAFLALPTVGIAQLSVQEFQIPRSGAFPHDPAVAADGIVWYTDQSNSYIGRFDPSTKSFTDYATPTRGSGPHGITVAPDGFIWYTAQSSGRLGRVHPVTKVITEYVMPSNANRPHTPIAHQGVIWFTAQNNSTYGKFDPKTLKTQVYSAPSGSRPYGICPAPDGSVWIALFGTNKLGRVNTSTGALTLFNLPSSRARPRRLAIGNEGSVYYTDYARGYLGRLDPKTSKFVEWKVPGSRPYGIAVGTDGRVWFHDVGSNQMVGFDPITQKMSTVKVPTSGPTVRHMVCDWVRGRLWLALSGTQRLGSVQLVVPITQFGKACAGSKGLPVLGVSGVPRIGETIIIEASNTTATTGALFFGASRTMWSGAPLPFNLTAIGFPGCFINSSWDLAVIMNPVAPVKLTIPVDTSLGGAVVFAQWALAGDPSAGSLITTAAVQLTVAGL